MFEGGQQNEDQKVQPYKPVNDHPSKKWRIQMTFVDLGILILRVVLGSIFIAHGTQKLFGWFGGGGMEGTQGFIGKLGLKPEKFWANVAALPP
jgi:uncharacterized membrane protein YphA (DoxX/SURF4 family)